MATNVLACPKCRLPVRLRDDETTAPCGGCGAVVERVGSNGSRGDTAHGPAERGRHGALVGSLLLLAAGTTMLAVQRRRVVHPPPQPTTPTPIYTAPVLPREAPTPAGEIAWQAGARAPVAASANGDAVEDIVGFFRVWDGSSAWVSHAGAFDGATLRPLWTSEALDPQIVKLGGVVPVAVVVGQRVVLTDTSPVVRVLDLATGESRTRLTLSGPVADLCRAPGPPERVWAQIVGGGDTMVDLSTDKMTLAPRPKTCAEPAYLAERAPSPSKHATAAELAAAAHAAAVVKACREAFANGAGARAACRVPEGVGAADGFSPAYELHDGSVAVAFGTKGGKPHAESAAKTAAWARSLGADDSTTTADTPAVADVADGSVYVVYERRFQDQILTSLDAASGKPRWQVPLTGSVLTGDGTGRGVARTLVATPARVYVARSGGGLDVFDAATGSSVGTIGKR